MYVERMWDKIPKKWRYDVIQSEMNRFDLSDEYVGDWFKQKLRTGVVDEKQLGEKIKENKNIKCS